MTSRAKKSHSLPLRPSELRPTDVAFRVRCPLPLFSRVNGYKRVSLAAAAASEEGGGRDVRREHGWPPASPVLRGAVNGTVVYRDGLCRSLRGFHQSFPPATAGADLLPPLPVSHPLRPSVLFRNVAHAAAAVALRLATRAVRYCA